MDNTIKHWQGNDPDWSCQNNCKITSWKSAGGAAAQGAITGAVAGPTGGASLIASAAVSAGANVIGGEFNRRIQDKHTTVGDVVSDAAIGGAFGAGGYVSGKFVRKGLNQASNSTKGRVGELTTKVKYATKGYRSKGNAIVPTGKRTPTGRAQAAHYDHDMKNVFTVRHIVVESKFKIHLSLPLISVMHKKYWHTFQSR